MAYPHYKNRSSKPESLARWRDLTPEQQSALPAACTRFAREGDHVGRTDNGPRAMDRWLAAGLHLNWLSSDPASMPVEKWVTALAMWRSDGSWDQGWGPRPDQPYCRAPANLLTPDHTKRIAA
jgi:hypothetical protein